MKNEQNKIGIIVADENEIQRFNNFQLIKEYGGPFDIKLYEYLNTKIYLIHSRIGLVNAAMATQYLIDHFSVSQVWNYGAVGASEKLKLYDVIIPKHFYYFDVTTPWYTRGQTPGEAKYFSNNLATHDQFNIGSGNSFINDLDYFHQIQKEINIDLIDMESCAIAQVCEKNKIKFFCVKGVSDIIGKNLIPKDQINNSINKAATLAFEKMIDLIKKMQTNN